LIIEIQKTYVLSSLYCMLRTYDLTLHTVNSPVCSCRINRLRTELFPAVSTLGMELILCFLAMMEDTCKMLPHPYNSPKDRGGEVLQ